MCLSHRYAVSRAYGCTLIPFHQPSWPQIREFRVTCGVNIMTNHHVWGWYPPQTITSNIHIVYTKKCLRHWYAVSRAYVCILIPSHRPSWSQIWEVGVTCVVMFKVDTTMCLRHWHVVSRVYGGTLIPFHWQNWSQIWEFRVTCWRSQNNALALWLRLKTTSVMGHGIGGIYVPVNMVWLTESQSLE